MSTIKHHKHPDFSPERVWEELRRTLSPQERAAYRGITLAAMTGTKYEELFGIKTAEQLIAAEMFGAQRISSDQPSKMYLFSAGRGLVASFNPAYTDEVFKQTGDPTWVPTQTMDEIQAIYLNMPLPLDYQRQIEETLESVVKTYVSWVRAGLPSPTGEETCNWIE